MQIARYSGLMRVVALVLAALALAAVSAAAAARSVPSAGLRGVVMRGPITPVCKEGDPCDAPAAGVLLRFTRTGMAPARVRTGPAGGYAIRLRPGTYTVTAPEARPWMLLTPSRVRVPEGRIARVDFHLDTGIQ